MSWPGRPDELMRALSAKKNAAPYGFEERHSYFMFENYPGSASKVAALPVSFI
jgi:hypothetical protein